MENANVFMFEDHEMVKEVMTMLLRKIGHEVIVQVASIDEARLAIESLNEGDVDVALLDGNFLKFEGDESEGAVVAALLKDKFPDLAIIGMSSTGRNIIGATHTVEKDDFKQIQQIITDL